MFPSAEQPGGVSLMDVGEDVLEHLLNVAIRDADADDVTPPLGNGTGWTAERISWFREYHRSATALDGPARQKSWAIGYAGGLAGSIRLRWTGPGTLETGIWLARGCRGLGIGQKALEQVVAHAAASGATTLEADTTTGNRAALALLRKAGAQLVFAAAPAVKARVPLH